MPAYVLLDGSSVIVGSVVWDGVTPFPAAGLTKRLLPTPAPPFRLGDTYNANDTVTPRADTTVELATRNGATLQQRGIAALATDDAYLALVGPTNAQVAAQVVALTKQVAALIRLAGQALDTITDTA